MLVTKLFLFLEMGYDTMKMYNHDENRRKIMNAAYVYLQLYRLFDNATPLPVDCGKLCNKACCEGDEGGMYLFPGEKKVFELLNPDWVRIESSDFTYTIDGQKKKLPIAFCNGACDRFQRPLACRIFPLTPYLDEEEHLRIIIDPRAKPVCPLSNGLSISDFDVRFIKSVRKSFLILCKNKEFYAFLKAYSAYLDDFLKFYK